MKPGSLITLKKPFDIEHVTPPARSWIETAPVFGEIYTCREIRENQTNRAQPIAYVEEICMGWNPHSGEEMGLQVWAWVELAPPMEKGEINSLIEDITYEMVQ